MKKWDALTGKSLGQFDSWMNNLRADQIAERAWEEARRSFLLAAREDIKIQLLRPKQAQGTLIAMSAIQNPYTKKAKR